MERAAVAESFYHDDTDVETSNRREMEERYGKRWIIDEATTLGGAHSLNGLNTKTVLDHRTGKSRKVTASVMQAAAVVRQNRTVAQVGEPGS